MKTTVRIPYKQFGFIEVEFDNAITKDMAAKIKVNVDYSKRLIDLESDGGGASNGYTKPAYKKPYTNNYNNVPTIDLNAKFDTTELKVYRNNKVALSKDGQQLTELQFELIKRDKLTPWEVIVKNTKYDIPKRLKGSVNTEPVKETKVKDDDDYIPWDINL